jgi:5-methylcytosine-specific restriction endonuclease McrA
VDAAEKKRAYDREAARRHHARLRADPAAYAAYLTRERASKRQSWPRRFEALKSDPLRYAQYLERKRLRARERYPTLRANWTERQAAAAREANRRWRERLKSDPARDRAFLERRRAAERERYVANREALVARQRKYTDEHRQEIYARNRQYAMRNREKIRAKQHETYMRNLDANRARDRERSRLQYAKDPKAHNEYMKKWRAANPERARAYVRLAGHRRRAAAGGDFIRVEDWEQLLRKHKGRCGYCGSDTGLIEADHRVPLSRGGRNTIANILPACRSCNRRKHTKTDVEFRAWLAALAKESAKAKRKASGKRAA